VEVGEDLSHLGHVIQGKNELPFEAFQKLCQFVKIFGAEIEFVKLLVPIRRVEIEESFWPVASSENLLVGQTLDLRTLQPLMRSFQNLWNAFRVVVRLLLNRQFRVLVYDISAKCVLLKIKETSSPLYVGQRFGVLGLVEIKPLPADNRVFQIAEELFVVELTDAEEIDNVMAQIIDDFHIRWFFVKEDLAASEERFDIGLVFGNERNDSLGQAVLAADIGQWADHNLLRLMIKQPLYLYVESDQS